MALLMKLIEVLVSISVWLIIFSSTEAFNEPNDILAIRPFSSRMCSKIIKGNLDEPSSSKVTIALTYITKGINNTFEDDNWLFVDFSNRENLKFTRMAMQVQLNDEAGTIVGHFTTKIPCNQFGDVDAYGDIKQINQVPIFDPTSGISELGSPRVAVVQFKQPVARFQLGMVLPKEVVKTLKAVSLSEDFKKTSHHLGFFVAVTAIDTNDICYYNQVSSLNLIPDQPPQSLPMIPFPWRRCTMKDDVMEMPKRLQNGEYPIAFKISSIANDMVNIKAYKQLINNSYQKKVDKDLEREYKKAFLDELPPIFVKGLEEMNHKKEIEKQEADDIVALRPSSIINGTCKATKIGKIKDSSQTTVKISTYFTPYESWYNVKLQMLSNQLIKKAVVQAYDAETGEVIGKFSNEFPCKPLPNQAKVSKISADSREQVQDVFQKTVFVPYSETKGIVTDPTIAYVDINEPGVDSFILTIKFENIGPFFLIAATVITSEDICYHNQVSQVYQGNGIPLGAANAEIKPPTFPFDCDKNNEVEVSVEQGKEIEPLLMQSNPRKIELHKRTLLELDDMGSVEMTELVKTHVEEFKINNKIDHTTTGTGATTKTINLPELKAFSQLRLTTVRASFDPMATTEVTPTTTECLYLYEGHCRKANKTKRRRGTLTATTVPTTVPATAPTTTVTTEVTPTTTECLYNFDSHCRKRFKKRRGRFTTTTKQTTRKTTTTVQTLPATEDYEDTTTPEPTTTTTTNHKPKLPKKVVNRKILKRT